MKQPAKIDIAVLILFFNRPESLKKVFDEVCRARPSRLFLYQDGPRGERDMEGIVKCREVVDNVDWECDVRKNYQETNSGCDPSNYNAQRWAFSLADKCIVFEDDSIPSQSFFPFCKEMLDRYEHDERIVMVSGFNSEERLDDCPYDYIFTSYMSIWGWAARRRVIDRWDGKYTFLDDEYNMRQLRALVRQRGMNADMIRACYDHRESGREFYETIHWATIMFGSGLAIVPARNLINNLGPAAESTHYSASLATMPRRLRRMFTMPRYELEWPLRHPRYVIENVEYKEKVYRTLAYGHPWIKVGRSMEELALNLRRGNFGVIARAVRNRINKMLGRAKHC